MEINIIKESKNEFEFETNNLTIAELLRFYLNKDSEVSFATWKQDHPTEKIKISIKTKDKIAKKAVNDAIISAKKDLNESLINFNKLK
jgi:DNA-directed RNA polymerase subunit L